MKLYADDRWVEFGGRKYPIAPGNRDSENVPLPSGRPWRTERVRLMFENGWVLSIVWGTGTYSDNYDPYWGDPRPSIEEPETVELAAWRDVARDTDPGAGMIDWGGDTVAGRVPVLRLQAIIDLISEFPSNSDKPPASWDSRVESLVTA